MENSTAGTYKKILLYLIIAFTALAVLLPAAAISYLATPHAASRISRMLSDALGQPVDIHSVSLSDGALQLKGLSLGNPEGFPQSAMLSIDSLTLKPVWLTLLSDKLIFQKVAVEGITVAALNNNSGVWNFNRLQRRFSSAEPSSTELFIQQLAIRAGTLQVNDQSIAGLSLKISNLASKGSEKAGFNLVFDDPGKNHYVLTGKARMGKDPELEIALSSSAVSLKSLFSQLKIKSRYLPEKGDAKLQLSATLRNGQIRCAGTMSFSSAVLPAVGRGDDFNGTLFLSAGYDMQKDHLTVENVTLDMNKLLVVRATGSVKELKLSRNFVIDVGMNEVDIASIAPLIPELGRRKITLGGRLKKSSLHLSGSAAQGITAAGGKLELSHGLLTQDRQLLFNDLSVTAAVSGTGAFVTVTGKARQKQTSGGALLETLDAPYTVTLDKQLRLITARSPALSMRARGASFTGRLSYAEGTLLAENTSLKAKDLSATLGRISARLPVKQVSSTTVRYPVSADFSGGVIRHGDTLLDKVSGNIRGAYRYNPKTRWLEGAAELFAEKIARQGKELRGAEVRAQFSEAGCRAAFKASLLGGAVTGNAVFDPFARQDRVGFDINAQNIQLAGINSYAGLRGDAAFSAGTLDAVLNGDYTSSRGFFCHIGAEGKNIALTGKAGKKILSAGGIRIDSDVSGNKLIINEALLTVGKSVAVRAGGALDNVFKPEREGRITFTVPKTAVADIVDSLLAILPRTIQEATVAGSLGAEGAVILHEGKILVDGAVTLADINIDSPAEKTRISGLNGVLPLSLDLAGKAAATPPSSASFSRKNYDALLKQLRRTTEKGDTITISSSSFGGLRVDDITLRLRAGRGITEIISLDSSLYEGALLGKGFISVQNGVLYRGDLLFNNLSLVQICKVFPAITGYLSGKIDGIVSIQGKGGRLAALTGFTEFWARETSSEKMFVSREFLQRLSGNKLSGFFFSSDRAYDHAGIKAALENGYLTFDALDISHTNFLGVRDLSVTIAPSQNRIAIDHLLDSIKEATVRGGGGAAKEAPADAPPAAEFKWAD